MSTLLVMHFSNVTVNIIYMSKFMCINNQTDNAVYWICGHSYLMTTTWNRDLQYKQVKVMQAVDERQLALSIIQPTTFFSQCLY